MSRPSVPFAIVLGFIGPGAGLWYAGKPKIAGALIALFLAVVVGVPWLAVQGAIDPARVPTLLAVSALLLWGGSALAGALVAVRSAETGATARPPWVHPWWVLGVVVLTWVASASLRTRVVAPYLMSFAAVDDAHLEPELHRGALVVVKRDYAPSEIVPGALVLVGDRLVGDRLVGDRLARVKAVDGAVILDDGTRTNAADILGVGVPAR